MAAVGQEGLPQSGDAVMQALQAGRHVAEEVVQVVQHCRQHDGGGGRAVRQRPLPRHQRLHLAQQPPVLLHRLLCVRATHSVSRTQTAVAEAGLHAREVALQVPARRKDGQRHLNINR